ncbi:hypothetical protein V6N13_074032 [Hibiscus sabdariffa]
MHIISWNVRGLGGAAKRRGVRDVLRKQQCEMVFLLESKLELVSEVLVFGLWPHDVFDFVFAPSVGFGWYSGDLGLFAFSVGMVRGVVTVRGLEGCLVTG